MNPTLAGFYQFITNVLRPPSYYVPANDPIAAYAYDFAIDWVNTLLQCVPQNSPRTAYSMYARAVYNLAADTLIGFAEDDPSAPASFKIGDVDYAYWAWLRARYNIDSFVPGVVQSASDTGTSVSYMVFDTFKNYTIANLQNVKTPYGRFYLGIATSWGSTWGLD
jgi:hypothetical protein